MRVPLIAVIFKDLLLIVILRKQKHIHNSITAGILLYVVLQDRYFIYTIFITFTQRNQTTSSIK